MQEYDEDEDEMSDEDITSSTAKQAREKLKQVSEW